MCNPSHWCYYWVCWKQRKQKSVQIKKKQKQKKHQKLFLNMQDFKYLKEKDTLSVNSYLKDNLVKRPRNATSLLYFEGDCVQKTNRAQTEVKRNK